MGLFSRKKKPKKIQENPYPGLREMAFSTSPEQLNIVFQDNELAVYGVIAEWNMGDATITLVAYATGDTSLYLSSGGIFIGAGQHTDVNELVKSFVQFSNTMLENASHDESNSMPVGDEIKFHFKTNKGKYVVIDRMSNIESRTTQNAKYFDAINQVITAIRIKSEK